MPQSLTFFCSPSKIVVSVKPFRSASRGSIVSKGVDLRIEELKSQNKQLLEELFTLKKACESKEQELTELKEKVTGVYLKLNKQTNKTKNCLSQPSGNIKLDRFSPLEVP